MISLLFRSIVRILPSLLTMSTLAAQPPMPAWEKSATMARVVQSGVVRVGYIPTPGTFAFQDGQGQTVGYSIDICLKVIDSLRKALARPDLRPEFRPLKPSERIPLLRAGEIDIECGGNTNTMSRQKEVDFSHTFFNTGLRLLARNSLRIDKSADLWKKRIAVSKGTTAEAMFNQLKAEQNLEVIPVGSDPEGVQLVETGKADAFAQDDILLYGLIARSRLKDQLAVTGRFMTVEPYAFMLPKDDVPFREVVDKTLLSLMATGELLSIYRKWFDTDQQRIPLSAYMKENIRFPNKYGIP